jgi:hypothetical protein
MEHELKQLLESVQRNRNCAQNSILRCRERILEIQKEMTYYEGQRDEADVIIGNIETIIRGGQLPSPYCVQNQCDDLTDTKASDE